MIDREELGRIVYAAEIEANTQVELPAIAASAYASYDDLTPELKEIECRVGEAVQACVLGKPLAVVVCPSCTFSVEIPRGSTVAVCWCHAVVRVPETLYKVPTTWPEVPEL